MFGKALLIALLTCVVSLTAGRSTAYAQGAIGQGDPTGAVTGTAKDVTVKDAEEPDDRRSDGDCRSQQDRHQHRLDAARRLPRHVHAGRVRDGGDRASPAPRTPPTR